MEPFASCSASIHLLMPKGNFMSLRPLISRHSRRPQQDLYGFRAHHALLASVCAAALFSTGGEAVARSMNGGSAGFASAPNVASDAATLAAQQAVTAARKTQDSLARAAKAIQDMQAVQATARAAAAVRQTSLTSPVAVPDGLGAGGLLPNVPAGWTGANAPNQSVDGAGQTQVGIRQTQAQAILNWTSFNVGARTTLTFDQQGSANWVALNRVNNATAPSQILGSIKADGQVYVINQSGIVFGGSSQVNVGSLIASTAGITNAQFLTNGIYSTQVGGEYQASFAGAGGAVVVEQGALIATHAPSSVTAGGGFVALLGTSVSNAGSLSLPKGQALLAAGDDFVLRPGFSPAANRISTTRGSEVVPLMRQGSSSGAVDNRGIIYGPQGDITLAGHSVLQDGVLISTTSVNQRGTIHLLNSSADATGSVTLTGNALTTIMPELYSRDTALNSQRDALIADSVVQNKARAEASNFTQFDNLSRLADRQDQSRIEIVSGGSVNFKSNALTMAQGGQVSVMASKRVDLEAGAIIDVSGAVGPALAMRNNTLMVNVQGYELRDSPLNRDSGALNNANIYLDIRDLVLVPAGTGGYASDRYYTRGGLLEVSGYLANTGHTIGEWTATGGNVTLSAPKVTAEKGAIVNLAGGAVSYAAGDIITSNVLGTDGRIYSVGNAPGDMRTLGLAGRFRREHNIQGRVNESLTEIWTTIFDRGSSIRHEQAYTIGRDGGVLNLLATTSDFAATLVADVIDDQRQIDARPKGIVDGYKATQTTAALAGRLSLADLDRFNWTTVQTGSVAFGLAGGQNDASVAHRLDAAALSSFNLGGLAVSSIAKLDVLAPLTLASGGILNLAGGDVTVGSDLTARGGSVTLNGLTMTVKQGVSIDTRGLSTNVLLDPNTDRSRFAFVNGGAISLTADNLILERGSRLDASAGGAIDFNRKTRGGDGGDVTLTGRNGLVLDGKLVSYGYGKGGKLSISTSTPITVGGMPLRNNGQLAADEAAPIDLALAEPLELLAGMKAPFALTVSISSVPNGRTIPADATIDTSRPVTIGPAGWTVPANAGGVYDTNGIYHPPGDVLLPGTVVTIYNQLGGYVIPPDSFVGGLPIVPRLVTVAAGEALPVNTTLAADSLIARGTVLGAAVSVHPVLVMEQSQFNAGFSSYSVKSQVGFSILPGTELSVTQPVFQFTADRFNAATGSDPHATFLPPLFIEDMVNGKLAQRGGADIVIGNPAERDQNAGALTSQGSVWLGAGAAITVDPGRSVGIGSTGQITIEGSVTARGGNITIVNNRRQEDITSTEPYLLSGRSVWIGDDARLDASGIAVTATDRRGRSYGMVTDGGKIVLGALNRRPGIENNLQGGNAFLVIRPGAVIDASGASAMIDVTSDGGMFGRTASDSRLVASDGGLIALSSQWGILIDGTLRATAGGAGASGGTLSLMLETPVIPVIQGYSTNPDVLPDVVKAGRVLTIAQTRMRSGLPGTVQAGALDPALVLGRARLGVDQVAEGGFGALSLWARGAIAFDGDISLTMSRSLTLQQGPLVNTIAGGRVSLNAPYIFLDGQTYQNDATFDTGQNEYHRFYDQIIPNVLPSYALAERLTVSGALVDIRNQVRSVYRDTEVTATGDLRFLAATAAAYRATAANKFTSALASQGNLTVTAAQVYPASGVLGVLGAGATEALDFSGNIRLSYGAPDFVLTIARNGDLPAVPYSLFGSLSLFADVIRQGGVLRAPMGGIAFGVPQGATLEQRPSRVELLPGSVTSVSASGLVMPYGGTVDGTNYTVDGAILPSINLQTGAVNDANGQPTGVTLGVSFHSRSVVSDSGSVIDLSGGGKLTGAAFVSGRGGSVDTLLTPLINSNPSYAYSASGNKVYALVPGVITAPVPGNSNLAWTGATLGIGQQITIPAGVAGLSAGTYTLLPANYALLPGAYRVEIGGSTTHMSGPMALGNGSYRLQAYQGIANTGIRDALPTDIIVTPGTAVRQLSQYNEQGFESFVRQQAGLFDTLRGMTEADAKFLRINLNSMAQDAANSGVVFAGKVDFTAGKGGLSGTFILNGRDGQDLVITGAGSSTTNDASLITVSAASIAAIDAPNLQIGAGIGYDGARNLTLERGVSLPGSNVFLTASNQITLEEGASINTLGRGFAGLDSSYGITFGPQRVNYATPAFLAVSNGDIRLNTPSGAGTAGIVLKQGSSLYAEGTVGFFADQGFATEGDINIGARRLELKVAALNIGSRETLATYAPQLPVGLNLTQDILGALLRGGGAAGAPAVQTLSLGANVMNFFGTVDLNTMDPVTGRSLISELVLTTPSIYGYGSAGETAHITTDTLIWNGLAVADPAHLNSSNPVFVSVTPGDRIAGLGNSGTFAVDARKIVFGYPSRSQPDNAVTVDRLMLGFGAVAFNASERVTANNNGTLSVYGSGPAIGASFDPKTYAGTGAVLSFNTPLMTADSGAIFGVYGNAVSVATTGAAAGTVSSLGGELSLTGDTLRIASSIVLPAGLISLAARGTASDLVIADGGRLDVAGHDIRLGGAQRRIWSGDIALSSLTGNVVIASGAVVDLSSDGSDAGSLNVKAGGALLLDGLLKGQGGGNGARDGAFALTSANAGGASLSDGFALLNRKLTASGFVYSRAFTFTSGDLAVGDDVRARHVSITTDGGSLTIAGRIDATGENTGSIRLAARDNLVVTTGGKLDARGTRLVRDSYGQVIDASNRNSVELTSLQGWVRLDAGSTIDTSSPDAVARGRVEINVRRVDEVGGDIKIDASGSLNLHGIASLAVNGFWTYSPTDANGTIVQDNTAQDAPAGAVGLAQIDAQNRVFYTNALANGDLQGRLAGLQAIGDAYHLRPGVEITSSAASGGKLTVLNDLDLSGYRYGPNANRDVLSPTYGAGEVMALSIRAAGDLTIKGSINDGFAPPKDSPDELGGFRDRPIAYGPPTITPAYTPPFDNYIPQDRYLTLGQGWTVSDSAGTYPDGGVWAAVNGVYDWYVVGQFLPAGTIIDFWNSDFAGWMVSEMVPASQTPPSILPQGKIWAIAPMLAPGTMSSSIRLVSGADLASADLRGLRTSAALAGSGNMLLDDYHTTVQDGVPTSNQIHSVIRTGTGDLELLSGGNVTQRSLYGIYTAGTQAADDAGFPAVQAVLPNLPAGYPGTGSAAASYFPNGGGDLLVRVQGNFAGYSTSTRGVQTAADLLRAQWLMLQGANELGQAASWSINFGRYIQDNAGFRVGGVTGFGAFGGGNVSIAIDQGAGGMVDPGFTRPPINALVAGIGSSGGVTADGKLLQTGGGMLDVRVGGAINRLDTGGVLTNLRGEVNIAASSIGAVLIDYNAKLAGDPRGYDPFSGDLLGRVIAGPMLVLGDATATVRTRGDLVMGDIVDPGILKNSSEGVGGQWIGPQAGTSVESWFSLWRPGTAADLLSLGGNVELGFGTLPPIFRATAASRNIYLGAGTSGSNLVQAPSAAAQLELLAQGSIVGVNANVSMSAADPTLAPDPFHPAYVVYDANGSFFASNTIGGRFDPTYDRFAFAPDTPTTDLHAGDRDPVLIQALTGDIIGLSLKTAKRLEMSAAGDIVGLLQGPSLTTSIAILHANATDVSTVTAGRSLIYPSFTISGPGALAMTAGNDIYLGDKGSIVSSGPAFAADRRPGASIALSAGAGSAGPDYAALLIYLDPANLAATGMPLADQVGKVAKTYQAELRTWLATRYRFSGASGADDRAYFAGLSPVEQQIFLRQVYYAELTAGGREYNDVSSPRYGSYLRGRNAIAALFPSDRSYAGNITMFGAAGVRTLFGGDIQMLTPGGQIVVGVEGEVPPASAGVVTQGQGNIQMYSQGSILLGLSRIMTTFGGNILAWSAEGDINAGRGSKTTTIYTPPKREYDIYGNVTLSPVVPSSGAGIATLNPIPAILPGDIDLIAPRGTIDAGEAGIRVSGNVNLAALQIVNAANIRVQGSSAGIPTVQAPSISAALSTSNAAAATQQTATPNQGSGNERPSVIIVEVLGYGGGDGGSPDQDENQRPRKPQRQTYDTNGAVQVLGHGELTSQEKEPLSEDERRKL
ncbi:MAG: filamentous hemagglutinin [Bradyrhizobiaceae bacterium PARB1]|jgi:filamentous hemagglutinin family protein|nr:MAG: filamentous hemagglutinin [Bradyrhizobiaceae bacterium PARB1]